MILGLQEFDALNSNEINDFRFKMRKMGEEIAQLRSKQTWLERLYYQFPPRIVKESYILKEVLSKRKNINIALKFDSQSNGPEVMQTSFTFKVPLTIRPRELIEMFLSKTASINFKSGTANDYILKVCGQDEFLVGDNEVIHFQYVQDCMSKDIIPTLVTLHIDRVPGKSFCLT